MSPELQQAVQERVAFGHSQEQITAELRDAGYDDATIASVYKSIVSPASVAVELPAATKLFKEAWAFALSRLDLLVLLALPTLVINVGAVALGYGWVSLGAITMVGVAVGVLALIFAQFLIQLTLAHTAIKTHQSSDVSLRDSWDWATSNVWPWLWIATLSFCVVMGGFLLFIIPGVIISFYIAFAMYAFVDEDTRGMSALQRSRALVTGNFWNILSRFVVFILIIFGLSILFGIAAALCASLLGMFGTGVEELVMSVFDAVITSFASLLGVYFAAGLYSALKQQQSDVVSPSTSYPVFGWLGAVVLLASVAFGALGFATFMDEVGPDGIDFAQMMNADMNAQMLEGQAELTPEQQAEFNSFMEEFGAELDSF